MEHIERAGIHSGDSISVYPAQSLDDHVKATIVDYTRKLAQSLHVIGLINIQFIVCGEDVYVIEVNPRSSRTVPYISKVTGIPIVPLATQSDPRQKVQRTRLSDRTCTGSRLYCDQNAGILLREDPRC